MPLINQDMNLDEAWKKVLQQVQTASEDPAHPFRFMDVATVDAKNSPVQRTVVLRDFDGKQTVTFFTDARSRKVEHIQNNNQVSLLFYYAEHKLQMSLQGKASLVTEGTEWERYREKAGSKNPHSYTSIKAPGETIEKPKDAYEWNLKNRQHFCVIQIKAQRMTFLQLDGTRHRRAVLEFKKGQSNSCWITP